jgi:hypothetical protein
LIWAVEVTAANLPDVHGARRILPQMVECCPRLEVIFADGAYSRLRGETDPKSSETWIRLAMIRLRLRRLRRLDPAA